MLITYIVSLWRRDCTNKFLKSLRVRNALSKTNWSLFSRYETISIEYCATCVSLCVTTYALTWSSMLIVANVFHSCHCFIVIFISFWFWYVSTSLWRRFLVVSRVILTIYKYSLLRCLRFRCFESLCVLIFIEASNLHLASVSSRIFFECVLVVFNRCLTLLIELSWVMLDCLSIFCKFYFCTRFQSQQCTFRRNISSSSLVFLFRHNKSTLD